MILSLECGTCSYRFEHRMECDGYIRSCSVCCPRCKRICFCVLLGVK